MERIINSIMIAIIVKDKTDWIKRIQRTKNNKLPQMADTVQRPGDELNGHI